MEFGSSGSSFHAAHLASENGAHDGTHSQPTAHSAEQACSEENSRPINSSSFRVSHKKPDRVTQGPLPSIVHPGTVYDAFERTPPGGFKNMIGVSIKKRASSHNCFSVHPTPRLSCGPRAQPLATPDIDCKRRERRSRQLQPVVRQQK
jgi:hypothetical protein